MKNALKQLLAGIVILVIVALAGFWYRGFLERAAGGGAASTTPGQACTADAKICPDGSAVGRTGPDCSFAVCPPPNVELQAGSSTVTFVLPDGYTQLEQGAPNQSTLRIYQKPTSTSGTFDTLTISAFSIVAPATADSLMLANTIFDPSGIQATSTAAFKTITAGNNTFYAVDISRNEGQVETAYYLPTADTLYRIDLIERNVTNWTDPNLDTNALPEHQAVMQMLSTVQVSK